MAEFIGSRISLISKSDIRYVGTLHEISSENSTVALENVSSFGTEGRKSNPEEEIPSSDNVYEYIIFRGSDVKDLRIEEPPKENKPPPPPQVPDDPAILGSGAHPRSQNDPQQMQQPHSGPRQQQPPFPNQQGPFPYQQNQQYPQQRFGGPQGQPGFPPPPNGYGYPPQGPPGQQGGFYGGPPPGFYPPSGQNFPHPQGPFPQHGQGQYPGPPYPQPPHQQQRGGQGPTPPKQQTPPAGMNLQSAVTKPNDPQIPTAPKADREKSQSSTPIPDPAGAPAPPVESKPDVASALANTTTAGQRSSTAASAPKSNRVVPAVPLMKPSAARTAPTANAPQPATSKSGDAAANAALQYQNATQAATAAVAAAMAKLPGATGQKTKPAETSAADNLTQKVNEMRVDDRNRNQQRGGYASRGRGRGRGGHARGVEVPNTDFDFETSNAKFNKEDLAKETSVTSPSGGEQPAANGAETNEDEPADVVIPPAQSYNKSSFYDNISSDARDREEAPGANRGAEFRGEERKRNMETFGMGNVDGYRGGYRGRGRGRGGFRGRGGYGGDGGYLRGRGGYRGRGSTMATTES